MTELEALAKDCIENHTHKLVDKPTKQDIYLREESIFIQGYRQSERQIEIDAKQIMALQKQNGELTDKAKELEAQIDKMKCCGNCQKLRGRFDSKTNINILYCSDSDMKQIEVGFQMCCCKWEIKEK